MSTTPRILTETTDGIFRIVLNRPDALNTFDVPMVTELRAAWDRFNADPEARVAVVTATGDRAFSAGVDLKNPATVDQLKTVIPGIGLDVDKPIVSAVFGHTLGVGFVLAMSSDIRIAADTAKLGYPEPKVGVTGGIAAALAKYVPVGIALEVLMTGDSLPADRAQACGFVNRVVPREQLDEAAMDMARRIAGNAPLVVQALKKLVYHSLPKSVLEVTAYGERILNPIAESLDAVEGRTAFLEKRQPQWTGR